MYILVYNFEGKSSSLAFFISHLSTASRFHLYVAHSFILLNKNVYFVFSFLLWCSPLFSACDFFMYIHSSLDDDYDGKKSVTVAGAVVKL